MPDTLTFEEAAPSDELSFEDAAPRPPKPGFWQDIFAKTRNKPFAGSEVDLAPAQFDIPLPPEGITSPTKSLLPFPPPIKAETLSGQLLAAPVNVASGIAQGLTSPVGLLAAPLGLAGRTIGGLAALGFGVPGVIHGAKRVYTGTALGETQEALEGAGEVLTGGLIAGAGVKGLVEPLPTIPPEIQAAINRAKRLLPNAAKIAQETVTQPEKGVPDASSVETPATVYGDVQPQPVQGQGKVPVQEGGPGVQPQAAPVAQAAPVSLTPEIAPRVLETEKPSSVTTKTQAVTESGTSKSVEQFTPEAIDWDKPNAWEPVTAAEAADPSVLESKLRAQEAGRTFGESVSATKRLVALRDPTDGKIHVVSSYLNPRSGLMVLDPALAKSVRPNRSAPFVLKRYTPQYTMLVKESVKNFHKVYGSLDDFFQEFGSEARERAIAGSKYAEPPSVTEATPAPEPVETEKAVVVQHMAEHPDVESAVAAIAKSPNRRRIQAAIHQTIDEIQKDNPKLTDEQAAEQAIQTFYEQSKAGAKAGGQPIRQIGQSVPQGQPEAVPKLSADEASRLQTLTTKLESGEKLTAAEQKRYRALRDKAMALSFEEAKPEVQAAPISQGPGAASPGDVPQESQLTQLSRAIQRNIISPRDPLSERIKNAVDAAGRWARTKEKTTQALAKMVGAKDALINGYLHLPKWTDFHATIGRWTGADQRTALEIREFQRELNRAVPNKTRQEAITNWIQANGDPAVLRQRAAASKPDVRKGYELALQLNPEEQALARNISSYLESRLDEGIKAGLLKQGIDNYVTQVWKRPTSSTQKLWADLFGTGTLNPNFKFAKQRIFDSYFEGEQAGFVPKNKSIGHLLSVYDLTFNRSLSARALVKELQEGKAADGMPITMTSGKTEPIVLPLGDTAAYLIKPNLAPKGAVSVDGRPYRPIDHWALRDWKWATKGPEGQNVFVQGDMLVHPDHWRHLNNVLKYSRLQANPISKLFLQGQALMKQTKLSLSGFHMTQEAVHALSHRVNPLVVKAIDLSNPTQKALVDHGLMVQDPRGLELFSEGSTGGGLTRLIPGLGHLQGAFNDILFRDYIPRLKMAMAQDALERNRGAYAGKATDDQILALTAREANAAFGELDYRMLGRSPTVQDFLRLTTLAPDFLEARARFVGQALKPYGREQRIALGLMAGTLFVSARALNKLLDNDYHFEKPFSVVYKGREYTLRTLVGDLQHFITDPRTFWSARLSPIVKIADEYRTGRDDFGIKRSSMEQLSDFASWFKPISVDFRGGESLPQAIASSYGVTSKSATNQNELYKLLDDWRSKQTDPKILEQYDQHRKETVPQSVYSPLRRQLQANDLAKAKEEYDKLRAAKHTPHAIFEALNPARPFSGSRSGEAKFRNALTSQQKKLYDDAVKERQELYRRFIRALQQPAQPALKPAA